VVEKMNTKTGKWEPLTHSVGPDVTEFRVPKLKEGEDYKFRVRAENDQGQSDPLDSDKATKVKNPFGTTPIFLLHLPHSLPDRTPLLLGLHGQRTVSGKARTYDFIDN